MKLLRVVACMVLGLLILAGCAHERTARWEPLPEGVQAVFKGSAERLWYVRGAGMDANKPVDIAKIAARIEWQWGLKTPKLTGCWPALFERAGAVWFITSDQKALLRYDGRRWIERPAHLDAKGQGGFVGICPGHGRGWQEPYNVEAGNLRGFLERDGVSVFDGHNWSYQAFANKNDPAYHWRSLLAEKDGKGILALDNKPELWRFRDGKWQNVNLGGVPRVVGSAVAPDGSLWLGTGFGIVVVPLDGRPTELPAEAARNRSLIPPLIINQWNVNLLAPGLLQDDAGRIYLSLHRIPPDLSPTNFGTIVFEKDGTRRFFAGSDAAGDSTFRLPPVISYMPMSGGGDRVWYVNDGDNAHAQWLTASSLTDQKPGAAPTLNGFRFVNAVMRDGTVYAGYQDSLAHSRFGPPLVSLMAYHPGAPDTRPIIHSRSLEVSEPTATTASDGALWAPVPGKGLCRFDGKEWVARSQAAPGGMVMGVGNGAIFRGTLWSPSRFALISEPGSSPAVADDLNQLVMRHPADFAKAFSIPLDPQDWWSTQRRKPAYSIAADNAGRVWVAANQALTVYVNGEPHQISWNSNSPTNAKTRAAGPALVLRVGKGNSVYVSEMSESGFEWIFRTQGNAAWVMKYLADGSVQRIPVAGPTEGIWRGPDGSLLVAFRRLPPGKEKGWQNEQIVLQRVDENGNGPEQILPESPAFMDKGGVLWLAARNVNGLRSGTIRFWKDGKEVGHAQLPGLWSLGIVSDKPGSVWVWTYGGLCHLVASDRHHCHYRLVSTSLVADLEREYVGWTSDPTLMWCKDGLVLKTQFWTGNTQEYRLHLLPTNGL